MVDDELIHIAVAPPANLDKNLVISVSTVINKSPSDTRLLLGGEVPKVIAHYNSMQIAESITQRLRDIGLTAIACKDSGLRRVTQTYRAQNIEFGDKQILFRDNKGCEKRVIDNNIFLIIVGRAETSVEVETTKSKTKLSLTGTLLTGGIPIWRKVDEKTTTQSIQAEYFARLYERESADPIVEILQQKMNYSFLGEKLTASSFTNFNTVVQQLREVFPQAIVDDRLVKSLVLTGSSSQIWQNIEINCRLIYLFHIMVSGQA